MSNPYPSFPFHCKVHIEWASGELTEHALIMGIQHEMLWVRDMTVTPFDDYWAPLCSVRRIRKL